MAVKIIPHCEKCRIKLIATQFNNGVMRLLCPECKRRMFIRKGKNGVEKVEFYSESTGAG